MTRGGERASGRRLALLFFLLALPNGLFLAGAVPLGQVADELSHVLRADALAGGELLGVRRLEPDARGTSHPVEGVVARFEYAGSVAGPVAPADRAPQLVSRAKLDAARAQHFGARRRFNPIGTIAGYFPAFYLPGVAAIAVARAAGAGPDDTWYAVRVANLVCSAALGAAAVAIAARGRWLLLATLLLPLSLQLAASASEDGPLIAASALAAAAATRLPAIRPTASPFFPVLAGALGCICLAKLPYVGLLALLFARPSGDGRVPGTGETGRRLLVALAIAVASVAWAVWSTQVAGAPVFRTPAEAGPLWPGPRPAVFAHTDARAQLHVLLARPARLLTVPWRTLASRPALFGESVGLLGWLNFAVPLAVRIAWIAALATAAAGPFLLGRGGIERGAAGRAVLVLAGLLLSVDAIALALYLTWTPVGAAAVDGLQGRYFLPLLPALVLVVPSRTRPPSTVASGLLVAVPVAASLVTAFLLPPAVARFYYFG